MSLVLDGATDALYCSAPVSSTPVSMSMWIKTSDFDQTSALMSLDIGSSGDQNMAQFRGGIAGDYVAAGSYGGSWGLAYSTSGLTSGWHNVVVVFASANDRRVYLDGQYKGTDSTNLASWDSITYMTIGGRYGPGAELLFGGYMAEVAVWTSALTDANAVTLASGEYPENVDAGNLVFYRSLESGKTGGVGSALTDVGTPTYDADEHPSMSSASYVDASATMSSTSLIVGTAGIVTPVDAAAVMAAISLISGSAETKSVVAVSGALNATSLMVVTANLKQVIDGLQERASNLLISFGNDQLWYEDI